MLDADKLKKIIKVMEIGDYFSLKIPAKFKIVAIEEGEHLNDVVLEEIYIKKTKDNCIEIIYEGF